MQRVMLVMLCATLAFGPAGCGVAAVGGSAAVIGTAPPADSGAVDSESTPGGNPAAGAGTPAAGNSASGASTPGPGAQPLPALGQWVVGTFRLEDTELAVTPEQAQVLLPLWQAMVSLSSSEAAASQEIEAVQKQIEAALTAEQKDAIAAMQLKRSDVPPLIQELGIASGNLVRVTPPGGGGAGPGGGGGQGGVLIGPGPGGGPGGSQQELSPEQRATMEARAAGQAALGVPPPLITALVELLEKKVQ